MQGMNLNFSNPVKLINFATHYFSSLKTKKYHFICLIEKQ